MKENKAIFKCDVCEKEIEVKSDTSERLKYPYNEGWCYLYSHTSKINNMRLEIKEKHFCSKRCMIKFISDQIKEFEKDDR